MLHLQLSSCLCASPSEAEDFPSPARILSAFLTESQNGKERDRVKREEEEDWRRHHSGLAVICEAEEIWKREENRIHQVCVGT